MIIGNDIVDLADAGEPSPRFVARVLGPGERGQVWRRWAAKEAAYKVLARTVHDLPFAHARFVVDLDERVVRHPGGDVRVRWEERAGAVACVGWQGHGDVLSASETLEEAEAGALGPLGEREAARGRLSVAVRLLAKRLLCRRLGYEWAGVEVVRPAGGPPEVWWRGARLPGVQISLSHDGRFVACAIALGGVMKFVESVTFWQRLLGGDGEIWPGVYIFQALAEKFLSHVDIVDPLAFAGVHGAPVLYLANHQVYLESMLFNMALAPLQGRPVVALAKVEHRERWLGRFIDLLFGYPGLQSPAATEYFDRESPEAIVDAVARLEDLAGRAGQSILVHVEGTRRRCARRGRVQAMSPLWPEVAVKNGWAIVPIRFVGGLPVHDQGSKLEAPVGFGSQTIRVGAPIAAAELAPLGDEARVAHVRGAINALSDNRTEEPEPADPIFAAAVEDWVRRTGVHAMAATILMALVRHRRAVGSIDPLCDALAACAEDGRPLRAPPGVDAAWVRRLGSFLLGEGESAASFADGAALQAS